MIQINRPACPNLAALKTNYKHPDNKQALVEASHDKCMYCETKVTAIYPGEIEHIKPKSKYQTLEFDWSNLGFVCAKCNNAKSDKYDENTPYINPYLENPNDFIIALGAILHHKTGSERGELTINDIQLNRERLVEKRDEKIQAINKTIDACMKTKNMSLRQNALNALLLESEANKEYSLFIKTLFKLHGLI